MNADVQGTAKWIELNLRPLRYSKQKIPKKRISFRQENLDWAECVTISLPHTKFSGVQRRTETGSKAFSLFITLDTTTFVLISVITHIETVCSKI